MPEYSYHLYDTALFSTTAAVTHSLFQVTEGGDTTHVSDFTNSPGSGVMPPSLSFRIRSVMVFPESDLVEADVNAWTLNSYIRLYLSNLIVLQSPLLAVVGHNAYGGHFAQAAAANRAYIGREGMGYALDPNLLIRGGEAFKVELYQGTALATANERIKCVLEGILTRPEAGR